MGLPETVYKVTWETVCKVTWDTSSGEGLAKHTRVFEEDGEAEARQLWEKKNADPGAFFVELWRNTLLAMDVEED